MHPFIPRPALQRSAMCPVLNMRDWLRFAPPERGGNLLEVAHSINISSLQDEELVRTVFE